MSMEEAVSDAHRLLEEVFGFRSFRSHQSNIIEAVLRDEDALVLMPTGGGKSLCYQIPALVRSGTGIVVSPLIALMQDQVDALREVGVNAAFLNSTLDRDQQSDIESQLLSGELDLLYVAPERMVQERTLSLFARAKLSLFAIDEAHCVSQWGHDFRPEYRQLRVLQEQFPKVPRIALTATADERTRQDIITELQLQDAHHFVASFDRPNIRYTVAETGSLSRRERLWRFIEREHANDSGIVYCLSRRAVEETAEWLEKKGRVALAYHAGLDADVRRATQQRFITEDGIIVVATVAFGMGIDKPDVRFVAHLNLPKSVEAYYQETGRAGRDGAAANAWMAYGLQDVVQQRQWIAQSDGSEAHQRVQRQKLDALIGMCETTACRRQVLLAYFGETRGSGCGNCDNCLTPPETTDATVLAQKALSTVYRTGQGFGVTYLVEVLLGKENTRISNNRHDQLSVFGIGNDHDAATWRSLFRQLTAAGYLTSDSEGHGTLQLTDAARPLLRQQQTFEMRLPKLPERKTKSQNKRKKTQAERLPDAHRALFEALRSLRADLARRQKLPPYVVAQDRTLIELAELRPTTEAALHDITGLGASKIKRYGKLFLETIAQFEMPGVNTMKLTADAAQTVALILQGLDVAAVAAHRQTDEETIYEQLAEAIEAGAVELETVVDLAGDQMSEIHAAFESCQTLESGDVSAAAAALKGRHPPGLLKCLLAELT
jgi:ATP-dependent DNA helicase RecQ